MVVAARIVQELMVGQHVCGEYVVDGVVPRGAGPRVYAAHHVSDASARFTVRVVPCDDPPAASRFRRGMAHAAKVEHRALAATTAYEVNGFGAVVVQRAAQAPTLRERLAQGPLTAATVGWLVCELAAALDALHGARPSVLHGALCPGNIVFDHGAALVGVEAAGIAHAFRAAEWSWAVADALREPGYTSPDEAVGRASPRADTFVLACIAYECLTGERPFPGADDDVVQARIFSSQPIPLHVRRPEFDESVDEVLARAWRLDRHGSYDGSFAFAMELARALVRDASRRPTWTPDDGPKHSGVRAIVEGEDSLEAHTDDEPDEPEAPEALDEPAAPAAWDARPTAPPPRSEAPAEPPAEGPRGSVVPGPLPAPPALPRESVQASLRFDAAEPDADSVATLAPPRYVSWAGRASMVEPSFAPPSVAPDDVHRRKTPLMDLRASHPSLGPPVQIVGPRSSAAPRPAPVPEALRPPSRTTPAPAMPESASPAPRSARPREAASVDALLLALPRAGLRSAVLLSVALVGAAALVTAGLVYVARTRPAPRVERVVQTVSAPSPPAVAAPPSPPAVAAPPPAVAVAPAQAVAVAPVVAVRASDPRPPREAVRDAAARLAPLVDACFGELFPNRRVRLGVLYEAATGAPLQVRVGGGFGRTPVADCLRRAGREVRLAPFGVGVWEAGYSFATRPA